MSAEGAFGFGVIGCGVISDIHIQAIKQIPDARLVAVCDTVGERARAKAEQYGCEYETSHLDLVARDDIDIVNVVVPSGLHARIGIEAANAGKHVICTKPIDVTLGAIDALIEAGRRNGVKVAATHQCRSYEVYRRCKRAADDGRLGKLLYGHAMVPWFRSDEYYSQGWQGRQALDGGGALMNQSIHYIDLLIWILGDVDCVCGFADRLAHDQIEVEDCGTAALKFQSGAHGLIQGTTCTYRGQPARLSIHGTKGNAIFEADEVLLWEVEGEETIRGSLDHRETSVADPRAGLEGGIGAHVEQISDVIAAIRENREPKLNGPEARRAVEVILAIYRSSQTHSVVYL